MLRVLEHLRRAGLHHGTAPDPRAAGAVDRSRAGRQPDGRWSQGPVRPGAGWSGTDAPAGEPSRGVTLGAMRVLTWWDAAVVPAR